MATKAHGSQAPPGGDETIHATVKHPWLSADRGWVAAGALRVGERVVREDGTLATVVLLRDVAGAADYYNLTVSQLHTYAVGDGRYVVHNCGDVTDEDLYRSGGGKDGKRVTARESDHDIDPATGNVKAPADPMQSGGTSTWNDPATLKPGSNRYRLPKGTELPDGVGVVKDGADVGGPRGPGHRSLYPTRNMPFDEWNQLVHDLPWEFMGRY